MNLVFGPTCYGSAPVLVQLLQLVQIEVAGTQSPKRNHSATNGFRSTEYSDSSVVATETVNSRKTVPEWPLSNCSVGAKTPFRAHTY